jgi:hypothetical protein
MVQLASGSAAFAEMVGAWRQDRWSDGRGCGLVAGWSLNGRNS